MAIIIKECRQTAQRTSTYLSSQECEPLFLNIPQYVPLLCLFSRNLSHPASKFLQGNIQSSATRLFQSIILLPQKSNIVIFTLSGEEVSRNPEVVDWPRVSSSNRSVQWLSSLFSSSWDTKQLIPWKVLSLYHFLQMSSSNTHESSATLDLLWPFPWPYLEEKGEP